MKLKSIHPSSRLVRPALLGSLAVAAFAGLSFSPVHAATLYWDTNDVAAGSGAATGTWGADNFWTTDPTGSISGGAYVDGSDVIFSAGTNGLTGTVTVSGTQIANSITLDDNVAVTISGGTSILLGGTAGQGIFVAAGDNAANTISTALALDPASSPLIKNAGTGLLTLPAITGTAASGTQTITFTTTSSGGIADAGAIADAAGGAQVAVTINSTGSGVVTLSGTSAFSGGLNLLGGTLKVTGATANMGANTNPVLFDGGTLQSGNTGVTQSILQPVTIGAGGGILSTVGATGKLQIGGLLMGSGTLIHNGNAITPFTGTGVTNDAQVITTNNNAFTGAVILNGGVMEVSQNSLGTGLTAGNTITVNSGAEVVANVAAVPNALIINNNAFLSGIGTGTKEFSGSETTSGVYTIRMGDFHAATNTNLTISGAISGSGIFNLMSAPTLNATGQYLTLSGNNSAYSAKITAAAGYNIVFGQAASLSAGGLAVAANGGQVGGIGFSYDFGASLPSFSVTRVGTTTGGVFGINTALASTTTLDLSTLGGGGMSLGALVNAGTYSATTLGADNGVYRLGGGGGTITFTGANALAGANDLVVGTARTNGGGTVVLAAPTSYTGSTSVVAGTLKLDFSAGTAPTDNLISATSPLTLQSGSLTLAGRAGGGSSQSFASTTLAGAASVTLTPSGGNAITLNHGFISRNPGTVLTESSITATAGYATGGVATTSASNNGAGILGTWAFAGSGTNTRYATRDDSVLSGQIVGLAGTPANTAADLTDTTGLVNYNLAAATGATPASVSANTIRYTGVAGTTAPGATLFQVNGLLNAGTGAWTIGTSKITVGSDLELVIDAANSGITISSVIGDNGSGPSQVTVTGGSAVTLSGGNTFTGGLNVTGGTVSFTGNTNLGASAKTITLNGGTLNSTATAGTVRLDHPIVVGANGGTVATAGSITAGKLQLNASLLSGSGVFTHTGASDLQLDTAASTFSGTLNVSGLMEASLGGVLGTGTVNVNAGGELVVSSGIALNNAFVANSGGLFSPIGSGNQSSLPAGATLYAAGNFGLALRDFHALGTALGFGIAAPISGTGSLDVSAVSTSATNNRQTVLLSGNNANWSGNVTTTAATLVNGVTLRLGSATALGNSAGATFITPGAMLDLNGITLSNNEPLFIGGTGPNAFPTALTNEVATAATFSGPITLTANTTIGSINGGVSGGNITLSGNIGGAFGITKANGITQNLTLSGANTFTGNVSITAGPVTVTNSSALGAGTKTITVIPTVNPTSQPGLFLDGSGGNITLPASMSFTLSYDALTAGGGSPLPGLGSIVNVAGNNTINGNITVTSGGGGATFNVVGGTLTVAGNLAGATVSARNIYLRGDGNGTFSGNISNGGSTIGLWKDAGAGTWNLSGSNSYTGATLVTAGVLEVSGSLSGTGSVTADNGGVLLLAGPSETGGELVGSIKNSAAVSLGGVAGTLKMAGTNQTESLGALSLNTNATLDFGGTDGNASATSTNSLLFASLSLNLAGTGFSVTHWSGAPYAMNATMDSGLAQDRLLFSLDPGSAAASQISFYGDNGALIGTGEVVSYGAQFEIVPVPEPSTLLLGGLALAGFACRRRRR